MAETLKKKTAKSVGWGFIETLSTYIVRFVIGIVLARLLTPNDYGLIGMVTVFLSISDVFVNAGFGQAFIQKKNATQIDANTVFGINFIIGLIVYGLFWIIAPYIATFFHQPILTTIIRILFVIIVINSLNVIQQSIIRKELQFKKRALLTFSSSAASGIIGIICAYKGLGVWSLVIQQISNKAILCVLLYITSPWRLYFQFSLDSAKSMFSFGSWLLLSNLIGAIFNQLYKFFVGKQYQSADLGLYVRANQFESMVGDTFSWVFGQVAFPVFSKIQDDVNLIKSHMDNFIRYSTFIVFPLLAILFVVAKPMVLLLLTEKWIGCVLFIKYFCLVGMMQPFYVFLSPLLQGLGRSKLDMVFTIIVCIGRIINILVAIKLGLGSLIIGEFFVLLFSVLITSLLSVKSIGYNYLSCFVMAKWNLIGTVVSAIIGLIVCNYLEVEILQLILSIVAMSVTYIGILLLCDKQVLLGAKKIMLKNGER